MEQALKIDWSACADDLKARWQRGESASIVAAAYSKIYSVKVTRNAVIGQFARRFGTRPRLLAYAAKTSAAPKVKPVKAKTPTAAALKPLAKVSAPMRAKSAGYKNLLVPVATQKAMGQIGQAKLAAIEAAAPGTGVSMMALEAYMCRRPTGGTGAEMVFCGNRTELKRGRYASYCGKCQGKMVSRVATDKPAPDGAVLVGRPKALARAPKWSRING